jgi:dihydropteroate synthase
MKSICWELPDRVIEFGLRPLVMGIVNVTPDSFSDGGRFFDTSAAIDHAQQLVSEGADIVDIGGESTRPGSEPVSLAEELRRVLRVVERIAHVTQVPVSIDTQKPEVAKRCMEAGASIINDVSGFRDADMIRVAAESRAGVIVMHMQGTPQTMQNEPRYMDVVREVYEFLDERARILIEAGVRREAICFDPGIGFGKTQEHNLQLLANLSAFKRSERPVCLGVSRKGLIGLVTGRPRSERMPGSLAIACFAAARGEAHILRTHDVAPTRDAALLLEAIDRYRS